MILSAAVLLSSFLVLPQGPARGAPVPIDLEMSGTGSVPWDIRHIKPGDRGTEMVTLRNAGTASGVLTIWVSDIVDTLAADAPDVPVDPGESPELSRHVLFEPVYSRLSSNMALPAVLADFPQSTLDARQITVSPISAGETIDLIWKWYLPETVGNAVQANSLTFTLHYTLTSAPVVPDDSGPPPAGGGDDGGDNGPDEGGDGGDFTFIITTPEKQTSMTISGNGTIGESRTVDDISDYLIISFERNTRILTADNVVPHELTVTFRETNIPDPPPGTVIVGPVYELLFFTADGARPVTLSKPARIVLNYMMEVIPEYVKTMFIASWDEENGWTQLQPVSGLVVGEGQLGALVNHFTLFTILGRIEQDEPPVIEPPLPARFEMNSLSLSLDRVKSGESTTVRVHVANSGEMSGEYLLTLRMNGLFVDSQLIRLEPGQDRNVSFVVSPFEPGEYEVEVNGLRKVLVVTEGAITGPDDSIFRYWPMPAVPVLVGAGVLLAVVALAVVYRKRA